jgi:hypothetical protein
LATTFYQDATHDDNKEREESAKTIDANDNNNQDMDEEVDAESMQQYTDKNSQPQLQPSPKHGLGALQRSFTASSLDLTAETYGNKVWVGLCWVSAVLMFFAL